MPPSKPLVQPGPVRSRSRFRPRMRRGFRLPEGESQRRFGATANSRVGSAPDIRPGWQDAGCHNQSRCRSAGSGHPAGSLGAVQMRGAGGPAISSRQPQSPGSTRAEARRDHANTHQARPSICSGNTGGARRRCPLLNPAEWREAPRPGCPRRDRPRRAIRRQPIRSGSLPSNPLPGPTINPGNTGPKEPPQPKHRRDRRTRLR